LAEKAAFQRSLLRWYVHQKRELPWRKNQDPYCILVSEFMLQQTRVETVIPYFLRFLKQFPTLAHLAKAPLQKVLKAWEGLGYYARARNLHAAAKMIFGDRGGKVPSSKKELLSLPGFGPYIAGAVASLAFNEPVAALDGNVKRVLNRLLNRHDLGSDGKSRKVAESILEQIIPPNRVSDFNQSLMELGARICTPAEPKCSSCPIKKFCTWIGTEEKKKGKNIREETWIVALIERDGKFLLQRKEGRGLLAGLWQFPTLTMNHAQVENDLQPKGKRLDDKKLLQKALRENLGLRVIVKNSLPAQEHFFTHIHVTMIPYLCRCERPDPPQSLKGSRWVQPVNFSRYPISTAMRKISALL
jgi:A/G-specific adenine glycosylase